MGARIATGLSLLLGVATLLAGIAFALSSRFRIPSASPAAILAILSLLAVVAWRSRRGKVWARRIEIAVLLAAGGYACFAPTIFQGVLAGATRLVGMAALGLGSWNLALLVRSDLRSKRS